MKAVIELGEEEEGLPRETVLRYLREMQSRIAAGEPVDLESPAHCLPVTAITGVVEEKYDALVPYIAPPLEAQ